MKVINMFDWGFCFCETLQPISHYFLGGLERHGGVRGGFNLRASASFHHHFWQCTLNDVIIFVHIQNVQSPHFLWIATRTDSRLLKDMFVSIFSRHHFSQRTVSGTIVWLKRRWINDEIPCVIFIKIHFEGFHTTMIAIFFSILGANFTQCSLFSLVPSVSDF